MEPLKGAAVAAAVVVLAGAARWWVGESGTPREAHTVARPSRVDVSSTTAPTGPRPPSLPGGRPADAADPPAVDRVPTASGPLPRCEKGANGGATDVGVTATSIKVFMNITLDGPEAAYTAPARTAVDASVKRVNQAGGICGRMITVVMRNGWFVPPPDESFAMLVGPWKSELDDYIRDGTADRLGIPVVGTDGLTVPQFTSRTVWPVGAPAASITRIAVDHAYRALGARTFALDSDGQTEWGREVSAAFRAYVASLPGASVRDDCTGDACDVTLSTRAPDGYRRSGTGRLANYSLTPAWSRFASMCAGPVPPMACEKLHVWTAFTPPIEPFLADPAVAEYRDATKSTDPMNALTESTYVGTQVLLEALRRTGPILTQARLRQALDELRFESALLPGPVQWGPRLPTDRVANHAARALRLQGGTFVDAGTGWVSDPTPGVFP